LEPICPAIIYSAPNAMDVSTKEFFRDYILDNFDSQSTNKCFKKNIIQHIFNYDIAMIAMEFMEGYDTISNVFKNQNVSEERKYIIRNMVLFELSRLNEIGYLHRDFHLGNVMVNLDYIYFMDTSVFNFNDLNNNRGRVLIIDFGRTVKIDSKIQICKSLNEDNISYFLKRIQFILNYECNNNDPTKCIIINHIIKNQNINIDLLNTFAIKMDELYNKMIQMNKYKINLILNNFNIENLNVLFNMITLSYPMNGGKVLLNTSTINNVNVLNKRKGITNINDKSKIIITKTNTNNNDYLSLFKNINKNKFKELIQNGISKPDNSIFKFKYNKVGGQKKYKKKKTYKKKRKMYRKTYKSKVY